MIVNEHLQRCLGYRKPATPLAILTVLDVIADENGCVEIAQDKLAEILCVSKHTVATNLKRLKEVGVITYPKFGRNSKFKFGAKIYKVAKF